MFVMWACRVSVQLYYRVCVWVRACMCMCVCGGGIWVSAYMRSDDFISVIATLMARKYISQLSPCFSHQWYELVFIWWNNHRTRVRCASNAEAREINVNFPSVNLNMRCQYELYLPNSHLAVSTRNDDTDNYRYFIQQITNRSRYQYNMLLYEPELEVQNMDYNVCVYVCLWYYQPQL